MANSQEARILNRELKEIHKDGILEKIYERQDSQKKKEAAEASKEAESPDTSPKKVTSPESPTKPPRKDLCPGLKGLTVHTTGKIEEMDDNTTEDNSPSKLSYTEGQSPVRQMPESFSKSKTGVKPTRQFTGISLVNVAATTKDPIPEEAEFTAKKSVSSGK